jgi:hypothetical protein
LEEKTMQRSLHKSEDMKLRQISFMIHPFCYSWAEGGDAWAQPYLAREKACARRWYERLGTFPEDAALAIIPASRTGPTADYHAAACNVLGDRCFLLDAPDCHAPQFWSDGDPDGGLLHEIRMALVGQRMAWNKEELYDALHAYACCRQFCTLLGERGLTFDRHTVAAEAWGESFDGCVTKYSLTLRRALGLSRTVAIDFNLSVPDARFLLDASLRDGVLLRDGIRLFIFDSDNQWIGLYTLTEHSLADEPTYVTLPAHPTPLTVRSKQGLRLWPQPEDYVLRDVPAGYHEPPQSVVTLLANTLRVPASAGVAYRLAKAPVYVFLPREMSYAEASAILTSASVQGGAQADPCDSPQPAEEDATIA